MPITYMSRVGRKRFFGVQRPCRYRNKHQSFFTFYTVLAHTYESLEGPLLKKKKTISL